MKTTAAALACAASGPRFAFASEPVLSITAPMDAPEWALLERQLLHAHTDACELFFNPYFDERGFLKCFTRWGADDGPDDAIENVNDWQQVHALGGSDKIREMYRKAYKGHVRQYTLAKTVDVPFAREGMDTMAADSVTVTLVKVNPSEPRLVTVQAGAYGEHQVISVSNGERTQAINSRFFQVRLGPRAGAKLVVKMKRFANQPTLDFPWDGVVESFS